MATYVLTASGYQIVRHVLRAPVAAVPPQTTSTTLTTSTTRTTQG